MLNPEIQKKLCEIARQAGTELHFAEGMPISFHGCQHTEAPIAVINSELPDSEQIYTILHEIGHAMLHYKKDYKLPIPWFINRPYENEFLSDASYKTKRILKQKMNAEWQADCMALCYFCQLGARQEFQEFLQSHPEKTKLMLVVIPSILKNRLVSAFKKMFGFSNPKPTAA
jgi:hypothetical protein